MVENQEIANLFKSLGLPIPRQFSKDPKSFLTQLVEQYSKGGDTKASKTPAIKQDFLGAVEKGAVEKGAVEKGAVEEAAFEPDFGVAGKLLKGELTDPSLTEEQAIAREKAIDAALAKAEAKAEAELDLEEAQLKILHVAEQKREQAVNTALEKAEGDREKAMESALAKYESDLDAEEDALKKEHLDIRKADQDKDAYFEGGVADKLAKGELTDPEPATEEATAEPEVDYTDQAVDLFMTTHNTEFDPKSPKDRDKLEDMKALLSKMGGLKNPTNEKEQTRFALDYYKTL